MTRKTSSIQEKIHEVKRVPFEVWKFLDGPNLVFIGIGVIVFIALVIYSSQPISPTSMAVAFFTAVYAFITMNQMRQSTQSYTANVRRDYNRIPGTQSHKFGLRNFGPGPALYLRVFAEVVEEVEKEGERVIKSKEIVGEDDPPLSLSEGEFLPVTDEEFPKLEPKYDDRKLNLYYSFVSRNGTETPENQHKPRSKTNEQLAEDAPDPRCIKLGKIREHGVLDNEPLVEADLDYE